jgi:hypothetical protein
VTRAFWLAVLGLVVARGSVEAQLSLSAELGYLDRRLVQGGVVERQTGVLAGGGVAFAAGRFGVEVAALGGTLSPKGSGATDADYARLSGLVALGVTQWLALVGGVEASVFASPLGSQRWVLPRVGGELRGPLAGLPAQVHIAASALVGGSTNAPEPLKSGAVVRAGVTGGRRFQIYARYQLERLNFGGAARNEQHGIVTVGARYGF